MIANASHSIPATSLRVLVGNKNDQKVKVRPDDITEARVKYKLAYCEVSAKNNYNIENVDYFI